MEIAAIWINLMPGICWWYLFHKWVKSSFSTAHDIFKPLLKYSITNASPRLTVRFLGENTGVFWKREPRPIEWRQRRLSTRKLFCLHIYSLWMNWSALSDTFIPGFQEIKPWNMDRTIFDFSSSTHFAEIVNPNSFFLLRSWLLILSWGKILPTAVLLLYSDAVSNQKSLVVCHRQLDCTFQMIS